MSVIDKLKAPAGLKYENGVCEVDDRAQCVDPSMTPPPAPSPKKEDKDEYVCDSECQKRNAAEVAKLKAAMSKKPWYKEVWANLTNLNKWKEWPVNAVKVGGSLFGLAACGDSAGHNNNINNNSNHNDAGIDGTVDASDASTPDAGDAGDGSVPCTQGTTDGTAIVGGISLVVDTQNCEPVDMLYSSLNDMFHVLCSFSNNRILQFARTDSNADLLGEVYHEEMVPGELGYESADVHPQALHIFESPFDATQRAIAVMYQLENAVDASNVYGGVFMHDLETGSYLHLADLNYIINCGGGCPERGEWRFNGPGGAVTANNRLFVATTGCVPDPVSGICDPDDPTADYVRSVVPGMSLDGSGTFLRFNNEAEPVLGFPQGYRSAGIAKLSDGMIVAAVGGISNSTNERPKLVFMNPTQGAVSIAVTRTIDLDLPDDKQLITLPRLAKTSDEQNFITVTTNGADVNPQQMLVVTHIDSETAQTNRTVDLSQYAKGKITSVLVDDASNSVYVVAKGATQNESGVLIRVNLDPATGQTVGNPYKYDIGKEPGVAEFDPDENFRHILVYVKERTDLKAVCGLEGNNTNPQVIRIETGKLPPAQ